MLYLSVEEGVLQVRFSWKHMVNSLTYKLERPEDLLAEFCEGGFLKKALLEQKIVAMVFSLICLICSCSSEDLCNSDMDCPGPLVCRENRCVGLYENIDILYFNDVSTSKDFGSYESVEVYSDELEEGGTDVVALDIYEPLDTHQYEDIDITVDVMVEE